MIRSRWTIAVGLVAAALALSCGSSRKPAATGEVLPQVPAEVPVESTLPEWALMPDQNPAFPPPRYLGAVGASERSVEAADSVAMDSLVVAFHRRVVQVQQRSEAFHPYFGAGGEFDSTVSAALAPGSGLFRDAFREAGPDSASHVVYGGMVYAFAALDREAARVRIGRRSEVYQERVGDAVALAVSSARAGSWCGFVRWANTAIEREARRVASIMMRDALGEGVAQRAYEPSLRLVDLRVMSDSLKTTHGWTLYTEFLWSEDHPPPPQVEPRIKQRVLRFLQDNGFKVGFGTGCPRRLRQPPVVEGEEEPEVPPPHHLLHVEGAAFVERTVLGYWRATIDMTFDARTCGVGTVVRPRPLGVLVGEDDRDATVALIATMDWEQLDAVLTRSLREVDLVPPPELGVDVLGS